MIGSSSHVIPSMVGVRAGAEVTAFPSARFCDNTVSMKRQTVITKKRRGPLPTGKGTLVGVRLQPDLLKALDGWAKLSNISRPEAIRRLIERGLTHARPASKVDIPSVY